VDLAGLRILLVGPLPPPAGGMANQTRQLAELLRGAQAQVELVQTNAPYRPAWAGRLPVLRALFRLLPYLLALWRAAGRCDVVHVMANSGWSWHLFAAPAIWVARWRGAPVVVNYRGGEAAQFLARSGALVAWSLRRCSSLVVPSGFLQEVFGRAGLTAQTVPNIIDTRRFAPGQRLTALDTATHGHVLVARNLEPIYDNGTALRAFAIVHAQHPQTHLTVAGSGPEETALRELAAQLGLQSAVSFSGRLDRDQMAELLRCASVALNPSRVDNMPNSILEALASGLPVVSTNVGGVPFIVQHDVTALLVSPQDPAAMAQALLRLLGDPDLARRLADNGLREVQRYTWERVAPLWAAVYRNAMAARERQRATA
jgi:glycosyltransferase involved in cell wall biosynthesis